MSAPGAPHISAEDVKLDHGKAPTSADARTDVATILSGSSDRASRVDAAKELVDLIKMEGPVSFARLRDLFTRGAPLLTPAPPCRSARLCP